MIGMYGDQGWEQLVTELPSVQTPAEVGGFGMHTINYLTGTNLRALHFGALPYPSRLSVLLNLSAGQSMGGGEAWFNATTPTGFIEFISHIPQVGVAFTATTVASIAGGVSGIIDANVSAYFTITGYTTNANGCNWIGGWQWVRFRLDEAKWREDLESYHGGSEQRS